MGEERDNIYISAIIQRLVKGVNKNNDLLIKPILEENFEWFPHNAVKGTFGRWCIYIDDDSNDLSIIDSLYILRYVNLYVLVMLRILECFEIGGIAVG